MLETMKWGLAALLSTCMAEKNILIEAVAELFYSPTVFAVKKVCIKIYCIRAIAEHGHPGKSREDAAYWMESSTRYALQARYNANLFTRSSVLMSHAPSRQLVKHPAAVHKHCWAYSTKQQHVWTFPWGTQGLSQVRRGALLYRA